MAPVTMESKTDLVTANLLSPPKITPGRVPLSALSPSPINPNVALRDDWLRGDNSPDADVDVRMHPLTLRWSCAIRTGIAERPTRYPA